MITENSTAKDNHKKQVADAYKAKSSRASSIISSCSEQSEKPEYNFTPYVSKPVSLSQSIDESLVWL